VGGSCVQAGRLPAWVAFCRCLAFYVIGLKRYWLPAHADTTAAFEAARASRRCKDCSSLPSACVLSRLLHSRQHPGVLSAWILSVCVRFNNCFLAYAFPKMASIAVLVILGALIQNERQAVGLQRGQLAAAPLTTHPDMNLESLSLCTATLHCARATHACNEFDVSAYW
jgi:hypothetical protein